MNALIVETLKKLRKEKGLSRMDLGKQMFVNNSTVVRWENGSPIPFIAESHTRAYLAVEQAQFEHMLFVEYDTPFVHFRLPPLTLQPLVENAVKHGMNLYAGPLRVSVRAKHTDSGTEISVEDNGPGFDPSDESKPHTTLTNIRQRLEMMCGAP